MQVLIKNKNHKLSVRCLKLENTNHNDPLEQQHLKENATTKKIQSTKKSFRDPNLCVRCVSDDPVREAEVSRTFFSLSRM